MLSELKSKMNWIGLYNILKADKKFNRICGDFKQTINRVVNLERYPIPKIEDLFPSCQEV